MSDPGKLVVVEGRQAARAAPDEASALLAVIDRSARDPTIDVAKLERLLEMQQRVTARAAEQQFHAAMSAAQAEMTTVQTDAVNPQTRSRYATYARLDAALRPIYTRHGFALSFDESPTDAPDSVLAICVVSHIGGHSRTYRCLMPADGKGAKGGDVMTKTHAHGAAKQYAMRYLVRGIFNVAIGEEDRDGNPTDGECISERQVADLNSLIDELGGNRQRLYKYLRITSLDQILACNYDYVVREVRRLAAAAAAARPPQA